MKSILFFLLAAFFLLSSCEYNPGISEAFTKYRFKDGVTTITIPGWVIGIAANFGDLEKNERELLHSIDKVRVLVVEDDDLNAKINLHKEFSTKINKKNDYEELMTVRDDNEDITIYGKMDENVITEMIILVGGYDNAMIYVKGEIEPELINDQIKISDKDKFLSLGF
ncbi:MAG TPA: DUF4252 domain-containing protein [Draconibacterium sp.]|nr:DUF4252 domain-containing protein [Draconibacterium sp.]